SLDAFKWYLLPGQAVRFQETTGLNLLAISGAFPMACLLSAYCGMIPTTARRSAYLVGLVYGSCFLATMAAAVSQPALFRQFSQIAVLEILFITPFAALCIASARKLDTLGRQLFEARRLGQYTLERKLGAGGMGEVYLARHQFLRRPCAVKLIR